MDCIAETAESLSQVSTDLVAAAAHHGFGVPHVPQLGATLRSKLIG